MYVEQTSHRKQTADQRKNMFLGFSIGFDEFFLQYSIRFAYFLFDTIHCYSLPLYSGRGKFMPLPLKSKILETP
jgi:hypothetical protein